MSQAKLPDELVELKLKDMLVGEWTYEVPWAMYADAEGNMWINGDFSLDVHRKPFGTASMYIKRHSDGFEVDLKHVDSRSRGYTKGGGQYNVGNKGIPVVKLKY